jgi:hypothetical protein
VDAVGGIAGACADGVFDVLRRDLAQAFDPLAPLPQDGDVVVAIAADGAPVHRRGGAAFSSEDADPDHHLVLQVLGDGVEEPLDGGLFGIVQRDKKAALVEEGTMRRPPQPEPNRATSRTSASWRGASTPSQAARNRKVPRLMARVMVVHCCSLANVRNSSMSCVSCGVSAGSCVFFRRAHWRAWAGAEAGSVAAEPELFDRGPVAEVFIEDLITKSRWCHRAQDC